MKRVQGRFSRLNMCCERHASPRLEAPSGGAGAGAALGRAGPTAGLRRARGAHACHNVPRSPLPPSLCSGCSPLPPRVRTCMHMLFVVLGVRMRTQPLPRAHMHAHVRAQHPLSCSGCAHACHARAAPPSFPPHAVLAVRTLPSRSLTRCIQTSTSLRSILRLVGVLC